MQLVERDSSTGTIFTHNQRLFKHEKLWEQDEKGD